MGAWEGQTDRQSETAGETELHAYIFDIAVQLYPNRNYMSRVVPVEPSIRIAHANASSHRCKNRVVYLCSHSLATFLLQL